MEDAFSVSWSCGHGAGALQVLGTSCIRLIDSELWKGHPAMDGATKRSLPQASRVSLAYQGGDRHWAFGVGGGVSKGLHGFCWSDIQTGHRGDSSASMFHNVWGSQLGKHK